MYNLVKTPTNDSEIFPNQGTIDAPAFEEESTTEGFDEEAFINEPQYESSNTNEGLIDGIEGDVDTFDES